MIRNPLITPVASIQPSASKLVVIVFAVLIVAVLSAPTASAQTDRLFPLDGEMVLGKIKSASKNGVQMTVGGKDQTFAAGTIEKMLFQGDPTDLTKGRESAIDGQYDQALESLRTINIDELPREIIKADAQYYLALSQARLALAGKGDINAAAATVLNFAKNQGDSWRFFDAAKLLGELAMATGNFDNAARYFASLRGAPSVEMKVDSVYQSARVKLAQEDYAGAQEDFEKVIGVNASSAAAVRMKNLSKVGLAVALAKQNQIEKSDTLIQEMIATLNPAETEVAAKIYNASGAVYEARGDDEGAILAYLHTHLMFNNDATSHVDALKRLIDLWTRVGKPDRAAQARGELQQRYPGLSG